MVPIKIKPLCNPTPTHTVATVDHITVDDAETVPLAEDDEPRIYQPGEQRGMELDRFKYLQPGTLQVGVAADGLPQILGDSPEGAEPGLTEQNLVCIAAPGRPQCTHLRGILTNAPGVARGFEKMRQIRRFCRALSTAVELHDLEGIDVFACLSRDPVDPASMRQWEEFEAKQKNLAEETAQKSDEMEW